MKAWHPYSQLNHNDQKKLIQSAKDEFIYTKDGHQYFDGISSWWLITHGHSHPVVIEAISSQSQKFSQVVFADFTHENSERLIEKLKQLLPPQFDRCFFSDNGSTAVEIAMKMSYQYFKIIGFAKKRKFISFTNSYHGDTCGAMSVSAQGLFTRNFKDMKFEVYHAKQGTSINDPIEKWTTDCINLIHNHSSEVCALIIEPLIQGAGGMIVWPIEAIQQICQCARANNIIIIFDEVMTGFGRTGTMFAYEQTKIVPDLLCLSKGLTGGFLPLGLTVIDEKITQIFKSKKIDQQFLHGHSFTANGLSCAAAVANIEVFENESTINKISDIRRTHLHSLQKLCTDNYVRETRVCGSIGILELNKNIEYQSHFSNKVKKYCLQYGVYIRPLGHIFYLMPPYCSNHLNIQNGWQIIKEGISRLI